MKKIISLVLIIVIVLTTNPINVFAGGDDNEFYNLQVYANGENFSEQVIVDKKVIYMASGSIAKYATYNTDDHDLVFMRREQSDYKKAFKWCWYSPKDNNFRVIVNNIPHIVEGVDYRLVNGVYYLPIHLIFPYLDSFVSVKDDKLIVESDRITIADAMYGFAPGEYYFNAAEEFADSAALAALYILPGYLFDTVTHFRFSRLDITNINGNPKDYKTAFETLLLDNTTYLEAISDPDDAVSDYLNILGDGFDIADLIDNANTMGEELTNTVLEVGDTYYDLASFSNILSDIGTAYDFAMYFYNYFQLTEDHSKMLDAVYSNDFNTNRDKFETTEYTTAIEVSKIYNDSIKGAAIGAVYEALSTVAEEGVEATVLGPYAATANVAGVICEKTFAIEHTERLSLLAYWAMIMNTSQSAYFDYSNVAVSSPSNSEKMRLSAILYLLASRECNRVMYEVNEERANSVFCINPDLYRGNMKRYSAEIDNIDARLMLLYLAKDYAVISGDDDIADISDALKSSIKKNINKLLPEINQKPEESENQSNNQHNSSQIESQGVPYWLVEPTIEADDIQPVIQFTAEYNDNGVVVSNTYSQHIYDKFSIIMEDGKKGLLPYSGIPISDINFDDIYGSWTYHSGLVYVLGYSNAEYGYILTDTSELKKLYYYGDGVSLHDYTGTAPDDEIYWIESKDCAFVFSQAGGYVLNDYNEISRVYLAAEICGDSSFYYPSDTLGYVVVSNGKRINDIVYDDAGKYSDGVIPVKMDGKWGYIDANGEIVLPFEFDDNNIGSSYSASNGYIAVCKGEQYALYDTHGNLVIDYGVFEQIRPVYEGMFWAKKDGLWGVAALTPEAKPTNVVSPEKAVDEISAEVNSNSGLRMREGPGTDYNVIGMLSNHKKVTICGYTDDWAYIKVDAAYGWVKMEYIEFIEADFINDTQSKKILDRIEYGVGGDHFQYYYKDANYDTLSWIAINCFDYSKFSQNNGIVVYREENCFVFDEEDMNDMIDKMYLDYHISMDINTVLGFETDDSLYVDIYEHNGEYYMPIWCFPTHDGVAGTYHEILGIKQITRQLLYVKLNCIRYDPISEDPPIRGYAVLYENDNKEYSLLEYKQETWQIPEEHLSHYLTEFE